MVGAANLVYCSPFDVLHCVLTNSSLFPGSIVQTKTWKRLQSFQAELMMEYVTAVMEAMNSKAGFCRDCLRVILYEGCLVWIRVK